MKNIQQQFLGGMSSLEFLQNFWEKKPLLIKSAILNVDELASVEDLIAMGMDENFETRMVAMKEQATAWQATVGPFDQQKFTRNDNELWTLIVHNLELYFKEFRQVKDLINFIPSWQFDDIMATYSVKDAHVGAHIDNYNVFIFQGKGSRKWELNQDPDPTYIEDIPIKILANFKAETEYILEEGDMLYIPPGVAHKGTSLTDSISYSIGFKAFDYTDMAASFLGEFLYSYDSSKCLQDKNISLPENTNEITDEHLENAFSFFKKEVVSKKNVVDWFTRYTTSPRRKIESVDTLSTQEIDLNLSNKVPLYRDEFLRFNYIQEKDGVRLIANEISFYVSNEEYQILEGILDTASSDAITVPLQLSPAISQVIHTLVQQGALFFSL